jgi:acetoin utilization protein AcuB
MRRLTVGDFMTSAPLTISPRETLAEAHTAMRRARIRHLPVLQGKRLVGLVTQSDLQLMETLRDVDPAEVTVREAMSRAPYTASPAAPLDQVCRQMVERRIGSTVVVVRGKPVGVFTTVDALRALAALAAPAPRRPRGLS